MYEGHHAKTYRSINVLAAGHPFSTTSTDGGKTWSRPVRVGPAQPSISETDWWVDGGLAVDAAGNLYAGWDTQDGRRDSAWLSYSTDQGRTWATPLMVAHNVHGALQIVEVASGSAGTCYVAWLTTVPGFGYALYIRRFSVARRRLTAPLMVSSHYGKPSVWPGDTFGIAAIPPSSHSHHAKGTVSLTWGSALAGTSHSEIFAALARP